MKPIKKSELYACPKCNSYFEVEQGDEMPGYCKHCETEFDEDAANKARAFLIEEIQRLQYAPKLNGCPMTEEWEEQLEICEYLLTLVKEKQGNA